MSPQPKHRYPGVDYFTSKDADIFCGRKEDTSKLLTQIQLNRTVVLHGESGVGKSSIIQAGIVPALASITDWQKFIPITIRFEGNKKLANKEDNVSMRSPNTLILEVIDAIQPRFSNPEVPFVAAEPTSVWWWCKALELQGHNLLLIFDQFEQLQSYSSDQINTFKVQLAELFRTAMPTFIYQQIQQRYALGTASNTPISEPDLLTLGRIEQPLQTRAIFVVREDKLGTMSLLSDYFPDILKNDYLLNQLDTKNATRAILEPAKLPNTEAPYLSDFSFDTNAETELIVALTDQKTGLIDPLQIQLVCRDIERNIVLGNGKKIITQKDIPPLANIIKTFYWNSWKKTEHLFPDNDAYHQKRKLLISELVINGKRNLVHEDNLILSDPDAEVLKTMVDESFVRAIPLGRDNFYQLSHDRLIQPALEDLAVLDAEEKAKREKDDLLKKAAQTRREKIWLGAFSIMAGFAVVLLLWSLSNAKKAQEALKSAYQKLELSADTIRRNADSLTRVTAYARSQRDTALVAAARATKEEQNAKIATKNADKATYQAQLERMKADSLRIVAEGQKELASKNLKMASEQERKASRLTVLSIAQYLGTRAESYTNDKSLNLLLAKQAYNLNLKESGYPFQKEIYQGLLNAIFFSKPERFILNPPQKNDLGESGSNPNGSAIRGMALWKNGMNLLVCSEKEIYTIPVTGGRAIALKHEDQGPYQSLALDNSEKSFYYGTPRALVKHHVETGDDSTLFVGFADNIRILNDGTIVFTTAGNEIAVLLKDKTVRKSLRFPGVINDIKSASDSVLLVACQDSVFTYNIRSNQWRPRANFKEIITSICPSTNEIYFGTATGAMLSVSEVNKSLSGNAFAYKHPGPVNVLVQAKNFTFSLSATTLAFWQNGFTDKLPIEITSFKSRALCMTITQGLQYLFVGTYDGLIYKYPLDPAQLAGEVCQYTSRDLTEEEWSLLISKEMPYENICPQKK